MYVNVCKLLAPIMVGDASLIVRHKSFRVLPTGDSVLMDRFSKVEKKREKWQRVQRMGKESELRLIKRIERDERVESDPSVARLNASSKLTSLKHRLRNRGFCRETRPYSPPPNVEQKMESLSLQVFESSERKSEYDWKELPLTDPLLKFKFLTICCREFDYEVPNSMLYLMRKVSDVVHFYSTPIRGVSSYDQMVQNAHQLPQNVHVISEPIRYNPDHDEFFQGINAYPFSSYKVYGLRAKKKYPEFKSTFEWPDV